MFENLVNCMHRGESIGYVRVHCTVCKVYTIITIARHIIRVKRLMAKEPEQNAELLSVCLWRDVL